MKNTLDFIKMSDFKLKKAFNYKKAYDKISDSNLFDEEFYKENFYSSNASNDESIKENLFSSSDEDLLFHYLFKGYKEDLDPSMNFSTLRYLDNNPSVKKSGMNPLVHYVLWGENENKKTYPSHLLEKQNTLNRNMEFLHNYQFEEEPLVSIVILNHNGRDYLDILFKDFSKKANYSNFEVIFVDNASDDDSVAYLKSMNLDFPLKIIENKKNLSFSKANNDGVKAADGEYVLLLNNDIEPTFGWLNEMMGVMLNNDNVGSVGAKLVFPYFKEDKKMKKSYKLQHAGDVFHFDRLLLSPDHRFKQIDPFDDRVNNSCKVASVTAACVLVKKSIYEDMGGLYEEYFYSYEDVDFSLKLNKSGYDTYYCSSALLFHYESFSRPIDLENDARNKKILFDRWFDYLNKNIFFDIIDSKRFFSDQPLKLLFICEESDDDFTVKLKEDFESRGYKVQMSNKVKPYLDTDVMISFSQDPDIEDIKVRENSIKVLWANGKELNNFSNFYDLAIVSNEELFDSIENKNNIFSIDCDYCESFIDILKEHVLERFN